MSLRKSPVRTAALLAACKANAQKSTGPRTPAGKARSRLNRLEHGRRCRKLHRLLPEGLSFSDRLCYNWIRRAIENCFRPRTATERERALQLAIQVWCQVGVGREKDHRTRNVTENVASQDERQQPRNGYKIASRNPKQSLTFWTQARGRRAQQRVGERRRSRPRALFVGWYGYGRVEDWTEEPPPDPERDPMGFWHWRRDMQSQFRAFRRAQAREARRAQARPVVDLATPVAAASGRPHFAAGRAPAHQKALPGVTGTGSELVGGPRWNRGRVRPPLQRGSALVFLDEVRQVLGLANAPAAARSAAERQLSAVSNQRPALSEQLAES